MTDFSLEERELAEWLDAKFWEHLGNFNINTDRMTAWLLLAREVQRRFNNVVNSNFAVSRGEVTAGVIRESIDLCQERIQSHFFGGGFASLLHTEEAYVVSQSKGLLPPQAKLEVSEDGGGRTSPCGDKNASDIVCSTEDVSVGRLAVCADPTSVPPQGVNTEKGITSKTYKKEVRG